MIYRPFAGTDMASLVVLTGSFKPEGADTPTKAAGLGWAVTYTATGIYTITFTDRSLTKFTGGVCDVAMDSPNGSQVNFKNTSGVTYDTTNRTLKIQALNGSNSPVALDQASDGSIVSFVVAFSKSSLPVT